MLGSNFLLSFVYKTLNRLMNIAQYSLSSQDLLQLESFGVAMIFVSMD